MVDPEQLYQEVLQEEQQKGSSPPVAEGRAKAARVRAEAGSPHPKEPKWWPGSQPHFEGDGAAAPAEAEAPAEPAVEEAAAAEPSAPAEQPAAQAPAEQPAAQAPSEQPAAQAPAPEQPAAAAPAAEASSSQGVAVATRPTLGVTHGTPTGNRLRPEDGVATEAQFQGQQAVYDRRKLIDELIATGVPAVAAGDSSRSRAPWLSVLYLIVPLLVVGFLLANPPSEPAPTSSSSESGGGGGPTVATRKLTAEGVAFSADTIKLAPSRPTDFEIENRDSVVHNLVIFPNEEESTDPANALFTSPDVPGGATESFTIDPLKRGEYYFHCQYHLNMSGSVEVG